MATTDGSDAGMAALAIGEPALGTNQDGSGPPNDLGREVLHQADQITSEASETAVTLRDKFRENPRPYLVAAAGLLAALILIRKLRR